MGVAVIGILMVALGKLPGMLSDCVVSCERPWAFEGRIWSREVDPSKLTDLFGLHTVSQARAISLAQIPSPLCPTRGHQ